MKYSIFAIALLFIGCNSDLPTKDVKRKEYNLNLPNTKSTIFEYTIDGCQYLGYIGGDSRSNYLTHKGNCNNPTHNQK